MYDQNGASAALIVDEQMDGIAMSDNRANFLPTIHNSLAGMNNSNSAGYQNNNQMNRYSIEHPQGKVLSLKWLNNRIVKVAEYIIQKFFYFFFYARKPKSSDRKKNLFKFQKLLLFYLS